MNFNIELICYLLYDGQILHFIDLTHLILTFVFTKIMQFYITNVFKFLTTGYLLAITLLSLSQW